ncbi:L-2-amino-thiazoline-4-carboxylic acid hydrolase [Clostridium sp. JS66]|uniref:L-2-amino-thiazoline-4-carboxylic acid hydrolase n=1 Tax=Clostridium sp. JS66 TaxID=3064705 RepID=UPI00298E1150|nr:L-2-amino-thiazoline-4-carboxylic acid hydrolase [Clostridium sp. JS66]WPC43588.1 L-2-amino-thiazoline-4-carboxylic acid hydrolase [Clostridium sp. JS66]
MSEKKYTEEELTKAIRGAIGDRATWFYLLLKAVKEEGIDADKIAKKAITEYGKMKSKNFKDVNGAKDFATQLVGGVTKCAFGAEIAAAGDKKSELKFSHCALVEAWKQLGCSKDEIVELCRMANYGDFGIASSFDGIELDFPKMLSKGDECCHVIVTKK